MFWNVQGVCFFLRISVHNSCLQCCISTKLSKIVCLINIGEYIFCFISCKLGSISWLFLVFFWDFSNIINKHSYLKCSIFTKLSQTVYLIKLQKIMWFKCIVWKFSNIIIYLERYIFIKLYKSCDGKAEVHLSLKINLYNHVWLRLFGFYSANDPKLDLLATWFQYICIFLLIFNFVVSIDIKSKYLDFRIDFIPKNLSYLQILHLKILFWEIITLRRMSKD